MAYLVDWHERLHRVTGSMALLWTQTSAGDLRQWAGELRAVAAAMEAAASGEQPLTEALEGPKASDKIPDWLLEVVDR
jgi:hypothetical protein